MRAAVAASLLCLGLAGCGPGQAHEYPERHRAAFNRSCPASDPVCACTWDRITRSIPPEEYEAMLVRFREEGLMDPRITRARTECLDHK